MSNVLSTDKSVPATGGGARLIAGSNPGSIPVRTCSAPTAIGSPTAGSIAGAVTTRAPVHNNALMRLTARILTHWKPLGSDGRTHIDDLRDAIRSAHGCKSQHLESVLVSETFQGEPVWDGLVEVFNLTGHPRAKKVYAWLDDRSGSANEVRPVTELHIAPVVSAETAVQMSILQEYRRPPR